MHTHGAHTWRTEDSSGRQLPHSAMLVPGIKRRPLGLAAIVFLHPLSLPGRTGKLSKLIFPLLCPAKILLCFCVLPPPPPCNFLFMFLFLHPDQSLPTLPSSRFLSAHPYLLQWLINSYWNFTLLTKYLS